MEAEREEGRDPSRPEQGAGAGGGRGLGRATFSPRRILQKVLGLIFLGLALVGAFLPVLPTTPFILLAASLFARSSPRIHQRILQSRLFGPTVLRWQKTRSISARAKVLALTMLWVTIALSAGFAVTSFALRVLLIIIAGAVTGFILSCPTAPGSTTELD